MFEALQELMAKQLRLEPERITPETRIKEDLGADSLDVLQLLMTIEEDYGIVIPDEELSAFETVQDIMNYLEKNK